MKEDSIEKQLEWCLEIRRTLEEMCTELDHTLKSYDNAMTSLKAEKMFAEIIGMFAGVQSSFEEESEKLIKHIEYDHLDYIEAQCNALIENSQE